MIKLNSNIKAMLKTGEKDGEAVWSDLGRAFKNVSQSLGESKYKAAYLADGGFSSNEVTGLSYNVTFTGDYMSDDPVIAYIFSPEVLFGIGEARKTQLKMTKGDTTVLWNVTLTKITETGGDADEPAGVTLEISGNGAPVVTVDGGENEPSDSTPPDNEDENTSDGGEADNGTNDTVTEGETDSGTNDTVTEGEAEEL